MQREPPTNATGPVGGVNLQRATVWMAVGTGASRLTGVLRVFALLYALGFTKLADAYNLANTTPNMLYDVVLGGVLAATFIPVFVESLSTRDEAEAWRSISAIVTLAAVVLVVSSVACWFAAPSIISGLTVLAHTKTSLAATTLLQERSVATTLLRWFVPQIALYGLISLASALLNIKGRFIAPMWVPIANNVVIIGVLIWFHHLTNFPTVTQVSIHPSWLILLGLGTTLGVALQTLMLIPSLSAARLSGLRWVWNPANEAVKKVFHLGAWTFGFVVANQIALFIVLALAVGTGGSAPVSSYTYAFSFFLMPYAVVAVSVMSAVTPELAQKWATNDHEAFKRRLSGGLRAVLAIIVPAAIGMLVLARPGVAILGHGASNASDTAQTGAALSMMSLGLPGFCTFLYVVRVLQAMQRTSVAFWLYLLENTTNVAVAVALHRSLGVRGIALSLSIAYTVAAIAGIVVLRSWLGPLGTSRTWAPLRRVAFASLVMGIFIVVVSNISASNTGIALVARVGVSATLGIALYVAVSSLLARHSRRKNMGSRRTPIHVATSEARLTRRETLERRSARPTRPGSRRDLHSRRSGRR